MHTVYWLDRIPLWGVFVLVAVGVFLCFRAGTMVGSRTRRKPEHETDASLGTITGACLGLLGFMMAFTFGFTAERFQAGRQFLLEEVQSIETTYLRAQLLLPPRGDELRSLLRQYVELRVNLGRQDPPASPEQLSGALARSTALQGQMWLHAIALARADRSSEIDALFIDSLSRMIELQTSRATVFTYRIPGVLWEFLFFMTILAMLAAGYQAGLAGKSSLKVALVLALTFAAVILLIADLDRSAEGRLRVSSRPMLELQTRMQSAAQD